MRFPSLLIAFLAAMLAAPSASAETYSENFDASTSLPEGWDFVGGTFYGFDTGSTYYMNSEADYAHSVRNSLCCPVNLPEQYVVTPKVTGQVSFYVRAYRTKRVAGVRVYRCSDDGQTLGDEVTAAARDWTSSNTSTVWQQVSFNLGGEGSRLAFVLNRVYVDDFEAELYEEKEEVRALTVVSVETPLDPEVELLADEDNRVALSFRATLKNVGNVDLTPDEENFSVSLLNADGYALHTQPITETIPAGQTLEVTLTPTLTANSLITGKGVRFAVRENFTETMQYCPTELTITAYLPQMRVYDTDPTQGYPEQLTGRNIINFGNIAEPLTGTYYILNAGNAPLVITSIAAPESFSVSPQSLTIEPGKVATFTITLEVIEGSYGYHEGDVVITAERIDEFLLSVKGTTRAPDAVYVDFSNQKFPEGWTVGDGWRIDNDFFSTDYYAMQYQYPAEEPTALISPKLAVSDGESLKFRAKAYDAQEHYHATLVLSYSADGTKWTTVANLKDSLTEDFKDFEYDVIPAGKWFLRFRALNACIDKIEGYRFASDDDDEPEEDVAVQFSGLVVDEENVPVIGATLVLQSDTIRYEGQTDGQGAFLLTVERGSLDYELVVSHDECDTLTTAVSFDRQDLNATYTVHRRIPVGMSHTTDPATATTSTFDLSGRRSSTSGRQGIIIMNRRKVYRR